MKITKRQLRRIIKEAMVDEPIRMVSGDSFFSDREANPHDSSMYGEPEDGYDYNDVIVMSPAGDALLVGGQEVELQNLVRELEVQTGQSIPVRTAGEINAKLFKQMGEGYVELPMSWSQDTGWVF
jgi:hypothetical protein